MCHFNMMWKIYYFTHSDSNSRSYITYRGFSYQIKKLHRWPNNSNQYLFMHSSFIDIRSLLVQCKKSVSWQLSTVTQNNCTSSIQNLLMYGNGCQVTCTVCWNNGQESWRNTAGLLATTFCHFCYLNYLSSQD